MNRGGRWMVATALLVAWGLLSASCGCGSDETGGSNPVPTAEDGELASSRTSPPTTSPRETGDFAQPTVEPDEVDEGENAPDEPEAEEAAEESAQTGPPTEPTAETGNEVEPTPTAVPSDDELPEVPPVTDGGELGDDAEPGVLDAPVPEWSDLLESSDESAAALRDQLASLTDPGDTAVLYLALSKLRLGESLVEEELEVVDRLADPAGDREDWQPGFVPLVDTAAVLAAASEQLTLTEAQAEAIDPDNVLLFPSIDLRFAEILDDVLLRPDLTAQLFEETGPGQ